MSMCVSASTVGNVGVCVSEEGGCAGTKGWECHSWLYWEGITMFSTTCKTCTSGSYVVDWDKGGFRHLMTSHSCNITSSPGFPS